MAFDVQGALARALAATDQESEAQLTANPANVANPRPRLAGLAGLAISKGQNPEKHSDGEAGLSTLMECFHERVAILECDEGLSRDRATWMAALGVFVLPYEHAQWFGKDGSLLAKYRHVTLAIDAGTVVTFHHNGRVSFNAEGSS